MRRARHIQFADEPDLFGEAPAAAIEGLRYEREFLTRAEEAELLRLVQGFELREMRYKEYTARRRGISFGGSYDFDRHRLRPGAAMPPALHPLRARVAAWMGMAPEDFAHVLISEYRHAARLAPRRAGLRGHRGRFAAGRRGDAAAALSAGQRCRTCEPAASDRAALHLHAARQSALGLAAQHCADRGAALFHHHAHAAARMTCGAPGRGLFRGGLSAPPRSTGRAPSAPQPGGRAMNARPWRQARCRRAAARVPSRT